MHAPTAAGGPGRGRRPVGGHERIRGGRTLLLLGALVSCAAVGCAGDDAAASGVSVALAFDPAPCVGPTAITVTLAEADGRPVVGAAVHVEGNMNHAGMVPELGEAHEVAPGRYRVELEFTMGGDWFFVVDASLPDGRAIEEVVHVPGVLTEPPAGAEGGSG